MDINLRRDGILMPMANNQKAPKPRARVKSEECGGHMTNEDLLDCFFGKLRYVYSSSLTTLKFHRKEHSDKT